MASFLRSLENIGDFGDSRAGRMLQMIRRDMDLTNGLMRNRRRNEEVLSIAYQDGAQMGGASEWENLRENFVNLPWRHLRWLESQAISKKMIVKVSRDAGEGQRPGGPSDTVTNPWLGIALQRAAYAGGFLNEMPALIAEVEPRGTSVMKVGFHREAITVEEAREAGKGPQSVIPEVLGEGDLEAKPGQDHAAISEGLAAAASDKDVQAQLGRDGVGALLARKDSHDDAAFEEETDDTPTTQSREVTRRVFMEKKRVGEDVGWAPYVYDTEHTPLWWERFVWTVAEVKVSDLFTDEFKSKVEGMDARNLSGVADGGETQSTENMGTDARQAQGEDLLEDDEKFVEFFMVWIRRPGTLSGGIRQIVSAESPEAFIHASSENPHVDESGRGLIPGFFPFVDFTPHKSSLTVPERTKGIPPMAPGMTQIEKMAELNRLSHESALRHSLRLYEIDPAQKDNKELLNALRNGEDGFAFVGKEGQKEFGGKYRDGVRLYQFTGNTQEIDAQRARQEADWVKVMGMPPAVLQGMGTADTATQDRQGIAAGERESGAVVGYLEERTAVVLEKMRGLMRGLYDDEDWIAMLGAEGAAVMKAWQEGTEDTGDRIEVTFGARAHAEKIVQTEQTMKALTLHQAEVEPITGLPKYKHDDIFEELHRLLDLGAPQEDDTPIRRLQEMVLALMQRVEMLTAGAERASGGGGSTSGGGKKPNPPEAGGPDPATLNSGARRGTTPPTPSGVGPDGLEAGVVPAARGG